MTCRHSVTLLSALEPGARLSVETSDGTVQGQALLVSPMVQRTLRAASTPFVLLDLEPTHASYRTLRGVAGKAGVCSLDDRGFTALRSIGLAFKADSLSGRMLDKAVRRAAGDLAQAYPQPCELDTRVRWMMMELQSEPARSLAELSAELGLSVAHASRLFSSQLGIPLRVYALSCKIRLAARFIGLGRPMTDIAQMSGFADSAHFAKVWTRCYGAPPSVHFPPTRTQMDRTALPGWLQAPTF
ncbi:MAG: helix-turn-helix transcriptional regulator [Burkholderiales bacterium]|nr:helix-turn-helix transcriptional regulator [Burkholderiales bacterium]